MADEQHYHATNRDREDGSRHQRHMLQLGGEADNHGRPSNEEEHGQAIEEALDRDGGQRSGLAHAEALLQGPGTHDLAGAQRQDVVGSVTNDQDGEDLSRGKFLHGPQQNVPAIGAHADAGVEQDQGNRKITPINPRKGIPDFVRMLSTKGEIEKEEADRDPDPGPR